MIQAYCQVSFRRRIFTARNSEEHGRDTHWGIWKLNHVLLKIFRQERGTECLIRSTLKIGKRSFKVLKRKQSRYSQHVCILADLVPRNAGNPISEGLNFTENFEGPYIEPPSIKSCIHPNSYIRNWLLHYDVAR